MKTKSYMGDNYLMHSKTAIKLYQQYAKDQPIFDYHCHLSAKDIYENKPFANLTKVWLVDGNYGDHYKWRAMRAHGVKEDYITGNKDDEEKFIEWAKTVPYTIGNPLYQWTHMELRTFFHIEETLNEDNAKDIYNKANDVLKDLKPQDMINMSNVKVLCTTDDPIDNLEYHKKLAAENKFKVTVLPAFRPDKALNIDNPNFNSWVNKLAEVAEMNIETLDDFMKALQSRIDLFDSRGCCVSDHALDELYYVRAPKKDIAYIFERKHKDPKYHMDRLDIAKYKTFMLIFFGKEYSKRRWVQQYHIGALRNNSKRMLNKIGPDTGFDAINDGIYAPSLSKLMAVLDEDNSLPKTILYSLNERDNKMLISLAGCFQGETKGKIQLGSAWWFNDQKEGIINQLSALSQMGLLSNFVGMLTDSRSFMSYPRHDYFRRILCDFLGNLIENKEYPADLKFVGKIVQDICYNNAVEYFGVK